MNSQRNDLIYQLNMPFQTLKQFEKTQSIREEYLFLCTLTFRANAKLSLLSTV